MSPLWGHRTHVIVLLTKRSKGGVILQKGHSKACTRGVPETHKYHVPCGWTWSTRASKDAIKGHHKRGLCGCLLWMLFLFCIWMHGYSLDMWMFNLIKLTTLTINKAT